MRYPHTISLNEDQEQALNEALKTGKSLIGIFMDGVKVNVLGEAIVQLPKDK